MSLRCCLGWRPEGPWIYLCLCWCLRFFCAGEVDCVLVRLVVSLLLRTRAVLYVVGGVTASRETAPALTSNIGG